MLQCFLNSLKITSAFVIFFVFSSAFAVDQRAIPCISAYRAVEAEGANPQKFSVDLCVSRCGAHTPELRNVYAVEDAYQYCLARSAPTVDFAAECLAAQESLKACSQNCTPLYEACAASCRKITNTSDRATALQKCDANKKPEKPEPVDPIDNKPKPVDPAGEDPKPEPVDPNDPGNGNNDPGDNTGDPNVISQQPGLQGLGSSPYGDTSLGSTDEGAINFSNGVRTDRDGFRNLGGPSQVNDSFVGTGANPDLPFGNEIMTAEKPNNGNGGGNGAGGAQPGMPFGGNMGGGAPAGGNAAAAGARRSGGNYRNSAGDYLSRHSPFSYQGGGGSDRNAGGSNANRNVANKKQFGPKYEKKANDGKDALHRLFGAGLTTPASYKRNPYGACNGSVFCPVETFYQKIERLPNHDINPDSY